MSAEEEKGPEQTPVETPAEEPKAAKAKAPKAKAATKAKASKAKDDDGESAKPAKAKDAADAPKAKTSKAKKTAEKAVETVAQPVAKKNPTATPRRAVVRAHARYVRTSARKARMVCGHIRGKSVSEARAILAFTPREVARDWSKLLESAVANAENNHELLEDDLIVREAYADEGPTIKRFRPRAMGRATPIRKRTSHLTITLTPGQ
jgi:ribosomal protein L22